MTTSEPAAIPPQAITDHTGRAVMAVRQHLVNNGCTVPVAVVAEALEAAAPHLEDGWDAARDRITEANEARRDERERVVQLVHLIRVLHKPVKGVVGLLTCHGCDLGPHPEDYPDWPCSTAELVFTPEEITQAEREQP